MALSAVSDRQWGDVTNLLVRPFRASKAVGRRLARSVVTNPSLGGFALDMEAVIHPPTQHPFRLLPDDHGT
jgi:hypothetical protein